MKFLLDTNIVSETIKQRPNPNLIQWLNVNHADDYAISVLTYGEIKKGIELLKDSKQKSKLMLWFENEVNNWFADRIIEIDKGIAYQWGISCAQLKKTPQTIDSLIAATAIANNLKLVTRNVKDFSIYPGLELIDPF